jgi:hypothetical protein
VSLQDVLQDDAVGKAAKTYADQYGRSPVHRAPIVQECGHGRAWHMTEMRALAPRTRQWSVTA